MTLAFFPTLTLASALTLAAGPTLAFGAAYGVDRGTVDTTNAAPLGGRVIDLATASTVNVTCGETVTFVNGGKRFSYTFDRATHRPVDLSKIAPADFGGAPQTVYVKRSYAEMGG